MEATLSLQEAQDTVMAWETKLSAAQQELTDYQGRIGEPALAGESADAATTLVRLSAEVTVCEQAIAAAARQVTAVKRAQLAARIASLRKEADELDREAERQAAVLNEHQPIVEQARAVLTTCVQRAGMMRGQADEFEWRLNHPDWRR